MERFFRNLRVFGAVVCTLFILIAAAAGLLHVFQNRLPLHLPVFASSSQEPPLPDELPEDGFEGNGSEKEKGPQESSTASSPLNGESEESPSSEPEAPDNQGMGEKDDLRQEIQPVATGRRPEIMHAVYLRPGVDYPIEGDEASVRAGIDAALTKVQSLGMNTVIALLYGESGSIYQTAEVEPANHQADVLSLLAAQARECGMYLYLLYEAAIYPAGSSLQVQSALDIDIIDFAYRNALELAGRYSVDGLLIDSYYNEPSAYSYARYIRSGAATGYFSYMRSFSEALCEAVCEAFRCQNPAIYAGLIVDGVWENASNDPEGSETAQDFTALCSGNADTRKMVAEGGFDFIVMRPGGSTDSTAEPFLQTAEWWNEQADRAGIALYILHPSDKICTDAPGYQSPDELVQQVIYARDCTRYEGSIFNSLSRLLDNPQSSTDLLTGLFENRINVSHVLTELAVSTPEQTVFSTFEPVIVFRGASDPNFEVTLNGQALDTDADGYFTTSADLQPGENIFAFAHKGKSLTYRITRNVQIVQEVSPTGAVEADGGLRLQVTALAYDGAAVSASLGGMTISLTRKDENDDDTDASSSYSKFTGEFSLPPAAAARQSLGTITVRGEWQGISDSMQGAEVTLKPAVAAGDGDLVIVTADAAKTFPVDTLNNESNPAYFPLPRGTKDYAIGDLLSFTNSSGTYQYYQLQSGVRVYAEDVSRIEGDLTVGNTIRGMKISSDTGYTYVRLAIDQPVPYLVTYNSEGISFDFQYTTSTPGSLKVQDNPVIRSADWSGSRLTLSFTQANSFLGYNAYYEGDTLVLCLTNPPVRLENVRVAIDPGHGGKDRGASGYYPDMDEKDVNLAIAQKTAAALKAFGIQVSLIETDPYLTLTQRIEQARSFQADIFLSIHANSSMDADARGTEAYYFYPNAKQLASAVSQRVAGALDTINRGGKAGRYVVTTDSRFASVLIECGFISNKNEYKKLTDSSYQQEIASGIAEGVRDYIGAISTGIAGGQGEEVGDDWETESEGEENPDTFLTLDEQSLSLSVGEILQIKAQAAGEAENETVFWQSDDESVALVDENGYIEAAGEGNCTITASVLEGEYTATCRIEVSGREGDEALSFLETAFILQIGEGFQLNPEAGPGMGSLHFESDNTSVATVDPEGWIEAVGEGETVISVWIEGDSEKQQLTVTVKESQ